MYLDVKRLVQPEKVQHLRSRRRACCCRTSPACRASSTSPRCATRWPTSAATREDQPAAAGRAGHRPLGAGRRLRHAATLRSSERRARVRAQPRALRSSCAGARRRSTTSRSCRRHRHRATRSTSSTSAASSSPRGRRRRRLPRHAGRHRLAHDDGQRPRRARLGRRRHRGRGGDARPAGLDAHPAGRRLQAHRRAARGRDRDRPRAHRHRDAAQARRRRQVRRVLRPGVARCRSPTARRSATCRRSTARPARIFPIDDETLDYLRLTGRATSEQSRWSRRTPRSRALARPDAAEPTTPRRSSSTSATSSRRLAGPKRPQDRVPLATAKDGVPRRARTTRDRRRRSERGLATRRRRVVPGATRPATTAPTDGRAARRAAAERAARRREAAPRPPRRSADGEEFELDHGAS
jgi:hypothetical protein